MESNAMTHDEKTAAEEAPFLGQSLLENFRYDAISGFLVFLIALPLCLGISLASEYPAVAGIFTAIVGGMLVPLFSNSELTIKGPAAGLIAVALGCVTEFHQGHASFEDPLIAYRLALGVGVAAGLVQIVFALCKVGSLGEFFPTAAVHGMLAAIGVIIIAKQVHTMMGTTSVGHEPFEWLKEIPHSFMHMNLPIAFIGFLSLAIMFGWSVFATGWMKYIPAPLLVLVIAVPLGLSFNLEEKHLADIKWPGGQDLGTFELGPAFLVKQIDLLRAVAVPDFSGIFTLTGLKYVIMFSLVGTLESLLSARAVDMIDPWKRQTDLNRDLLMVGIANTLCALIGGLPMISEIVRSKANIDAGARSRWSNVFHGIYLFLFLFIAPTLIHEIPLAALAAMLVFTGFRLASPHEFYKTFLIGPEQLVVFCTTLFVTLATDLLIGVAAGILVKFCFHLYHGVPIRSLFMPYLDVSDKDEKTYLVEARDSAIFSNWVQLKAHLVRLGIEGKKDVIIDLSNTVLVDHTVMENLHVLQGDFDKVGQKLTIVGFDDHVPLSGHELSARRKVKVGS